MLNATTTPTEEQLLAWVRTALGLGHTPRALAPEESPTCLTVWSVRELQDIYAHIGGGTVTVRPVTRSVSDGTLYGVIEVVLTADLPSIGNVAVVTDWNPADEAHGFALPVIRAREDSPECDACGAPADASGCRVPAHRPGSPCTVNYRAV